MKRAGPAEQLFDLQCDPGETHNRIADGRSDAQHHRLRDMLIENLRQHQYQTLPDGQLPVFADSNGSLEDIRNARWPGLHTEYYDKDVRH